MTRTAIATTRFRWKIVPWMKKANIEALWFISSQGVPRFYFQISPKVSLPPRTRFLPPVKDSTFRDIVLVPITDIHLQRQLIAQLKDKTVCGAKGHAIILGEMTVNLENTPVRLTLYTLLKFWRDWMQTQQF